MTTIEFIQTAVSTATPAITVPEVVTPAIEKGWHDDPFDQHDLRFHDGSGWTEHVTHLGPVPCQGCNPFAR